MSYVKSLLEQISKELKRPFSDFQPYLKTLESNWYSTEDDLNNLTEQQMHRLGIPGRLSAMIKQKLKNKTEESENSFQQHEKYHQPKYINSNKLKGQKSQSNIGKLLDELRKRVGETQFLELAEILKKIFFNIQYNLTDEKYRKINKGKTLARLYLHKELIIIIQEGGFIEQNNYIIMHKLDITHLNNFCEQIQLYTRPKFDPYKASIGSMTGLIGDMGQNSTMIYSQKLQQLQKQRQRLMSIPIKNRDIRISKYVSESNMMREIQKQSENVNEDEYIFIKNIQENLRKLEEGSRFTSKRKTQYQALLKVPCFSETLIRVKLPNNLIFECKFSPLERLSKLVQIFEDHLQNRNINYYLYMTPPVQRIDSKIQNMTFYDLGCVPKALFYFGSDEIIEGDILRAPKTGFFKIFT